MSCGARRHPKVIKLRRMLKADGVVSWVWLISFCAEFRTTGSLAGMDYEEIAIASDWTGEPERFVHALVEIGLVDEAPDGTLSIHDWHEHNPWAAGFEARSARARQAARSRWDAAGDADSMQHASGTDSGTDCKAESTAHANGIAPSNADGTTNGTAPSNAPSPSPFPSDSDSDSGSDSLTATASASRRGGLGAVYPLDFEKFWRIWPGSTDGKTKALGAWKKLTSAEKAMAIEDPPLRLKANWAGKETDKIPRASTYLNQKRWQDELRPNRIASPAPRRLSKGMEELRGLYQEALCNEQGGSHRDVDESKGQLVEASYRRDSSGGVG
jgi:hypothetical protein